MVPLNASYEDKNAKVYRWRQDCPQQLKPQLQGHLPYRHAVQRILGRVCNNNRFLQQFVEPQYYGPAQPQSLQPNVRDVEPSLKYKPEYNREDVDLFICTQI